MDFVNIFTSREQALIIWVAVILMWALSKKEIRRSIFNILIILFNKKIFSAIIITIVYVILSLFILHKAYLWETSLIKDAALWFLGTAFVLFINSPKATREQDYFKKIILENIKLVLFLEFIVNFYTFNIIIELIFVPLIFIVVAMDTLAGTKKELGSAKKLTSFLLVSMGLIFLAYAIFGLINNFDKLSTLDNLRAFIFPPLITLLFIPFVYLLSLFATYEQLFVRINSLLQGNESLIKMIKKKIIKNCHLNLRKLNKFSVECSKYLLQVKNEKDIVNVFKTLKLSKDKENFFKK